MPILKYDLECVDENGIDSKERSIDLVSLWGKCVNLHGVMSCFILYIVHPHVVLL